MKQGAAEGRAAGRESRARTHEDEGFECLRPRIGAAALALGIDLDAAAVERLLSFLTAMRRWSRVYNLTALHDADAMSVGHLFDCMAVVPALQRHAAGRTLRVLDAGSGGGLPGVVLAVLLPAWQVVCVDAVAKKAAFVRQVGLDLGLENLQSLHSRVQSLPGAVGGFDLIISRAFASLFDFTQWTSRALDPGGVWVAMKARLAAAELARLPEGVEVFHVEQLAVPDLAAQRCLVWMRQSSADEQRYSIHGEDLLHR